MSNPKKLFLFIFITLVLAFSNFSKGSIFIQAEECPRPASLPTTPSGYCPRPGIINVSECPRPVPVPLEGQANCPRPKPLAGDTVPPSVWLIQEQGWIKDDIISLSFGADDTYTGNSSIYDGELEVSIDGGANWSLVGNFPASPSDSPIYSTTYDYKVTEECIEYRFRYRARNADVNQAYCPRPSLKPDGTLITPPSLPPLRYWSSWATDGTTRYDITPPEIITREPINHAPSVKKVGATLSWLGTDNCNAQITYDIYFGTSPTPPFKISQTASSYNLGTLEYNTFYYWKIVARDGAGNEKSEEIWEFITELEPPEEKPLSAESDVFWFDVYDLGGEIIPPEKQPRSVETDLWWFDVADLGPGNPLSSEGGPWWFRIDELALEMQVEPLSVRKMKITWKDLGPGYKYKLYRSEDLVDLEDLRDNSPIYVTEGSLSGAMREYIDRGLDLVPNGRLEPDTIYYYRIFVVWP